MNISVVTICDWLKELNISTVKPVRLWIDVCSRPPKDDVFNIFFVCEPSPITPYVIPWIRYNWQYFHLVIGWEETLNTLPNFRPCHWRNMWITEKEADSVDVKDKKFNVSFVCGGNLRTPLHQLRRDCWMNQEKFTICKSFFYSTRCGGGEIPHFPGNIECPKETKLPLFKNSMFHIAIENSQIKNYYTEKIFDCFATYTVPIYLGCPNIGDFFDIRGIIIVSTLEEIIKVCNNLTEEDYFSRMEWMEVNRKLALERHPESFDASFRYHLQPILKEFNLVNEHTQGNTN